MIINICMKFIWADEVLREDIKLFLEISSRLGHNENVIELIDDSSKSKEKKEQSRENKNEVDDAKNANKSLLDDSAEINADLLEYTPTDLKEVGETPETGGGEAMATY